MHFSESPWGIYIRPDRQYSISRTNAIMLVTSGIIMIEYRGIAKCPEHSSRFSVSKIPEDS